MRTIFYSFLLVTAFVNAQQDSLVLEEQFLPFGYSLSSTAPFYHYQFPDGRIFVEVDYYQQSLNRGSWEDAVHPRGGSSYWDAVMFNTPNAHLILDSNGVLLENFGVRTTELKQIEKVGNGVQKRHFRERFKQVRLEMYHAAQKTYEEEYGPVFHIVQNGKTGCIDSNGIVQIPIEYDRVNYSDGDYFVSKDGLFGVYNSSFELCIPIQCKTIKKVADNSYLVFDDAYYFIDSKGMMRNKGYYKSLTGMPEWSLLIASKDGQGFFLLDKQLNRTNCEEYRWVDHLEHSFFIVSDSSNLMAIVDSTGKRITDFKYQSFRPRFETKNYILVKSYGAEKRYLASGLIDRTGKEILAPQFESIHVSHDGRITAREEGKWHLFSTNGDRLTQNDYDKIFGFYESLSVVQQGTLFGIINTDGKEVLPLIYKQIASYDSNVAVVRDDSRKIALVELNSRKNLTEFSYDNMHSPKNGFIRAYRDQQCYFIDLKGKEMGPLLFDEVYDFTKHGFALVKNGKHYGAINTSGKLVASCIYDTIRYGEDYELELIKGKESVVLK